MIYGHKADRAYRRLNAPSSGGSFRGHSRPHCGPGACSPRFYSFFFFFFYESLHFESFFVFLALEKSDPDMCDEIAAYLAFNFL
jgi:hypothetical protein